MRIVLMLAALAGSTFGGVAAYGGALDLAPDQRIEASEPVSYHVCPDESALGQLRRGDVIFATGRDASGGWVEIRDPVDLSSRVWIRATAIDFFDDPASLPVIGCDEASTTPEPGATPEAPLDEPTPPPTDDGSPPTGQPTPTVPPIQTPEPSQPDIGVIGASPSVIFENGNPAPPPPDVPCDGPKTSQVSVEVSDPDGLASVTLSWSVGSDSGTEAMSLSGGRYRATLGTLSDHTVDADSAIALTVHAEDTLGNADSRTSSGALTLRNCGTASG